LDEVVVPLQAKFLAAGRPFYFMLNHHTGGLSGSALSLRPGATGGDGDGSSYAKIILFWFDWMQTNYIS